MAKKRKPARKPQKSKRRKFADESPGLPVKDSPVQAVANKGARHPRHAQTGTTYQAKGLADDQIIQPNLDQELGSSQPVKIIEIVPELVSSYSRLRTYTYMMNDAGVDVSMRAVKTPVLGADFYMDPYSNDSMDVEIAAFIEDNLVDGMTSPFANSLEDILHFFEDGFAVLEKVYEMS